MGLDTHRHGMNKSDSSLLFPHLQRLIQLQIQQSSTYLLDVIPSPHGLDDRTDLLANVEFHSHTRQRRQNVTEQNASVGAVRPPGLQRNLDGHLGNFTPLTEGGVLLAQIAVALHVTAGLAHHPDGGALGGLATGGADEERILGGSTGGRFGLGILGGGGHGKATGSASSGEGLGGKGTGTGGQGQKAGGRRELHIYKYATQ